MKKQLNPTLVYVLSIFGLLCCCFAGLGVLLAGPAYFIANNKIKDAQLNPDEYEGDIKQMETAKIIALVILIINALYMLYAIYDLSTGGWTRLQENFNEAMEQYQMQQG